LTPLVTILACVGGLLATSLLAAAIARRPGASTLVYGLSLALALVAFARAGAGLITGASGEEGLVLPLGLPWIGAHLRLDPLAMVFLAIVDLGGATASLYAIGYGSHEREPGRVLPFFPGFLAAMNLVVLADDAFTFLTSWELMSLLSWALVMAHHRARDNARAGYVYLVMASFGTLALLLAFGELAGPDGTFVFSAIREAPPGPLLASVVMVLALIGTGSKAGLVPLHVWLPLAHPAAPSHVSALMSGVMTKVAVYGFIRIVFDLCGWPEWWWGIVVLLAGAATALVGVIQALMEDDLKRVLAFSTIENIGIVFVALGLALAFRADGFAEVASLALTAALFHAINHSLIKSGLFFGAGAVLAATGERAMSRLGGLIHRMPVTATTFLVGAMAISALPPLNGFVSEWLALQTILLSPRLPQWGLKLAIPAVGAILALATALAGACFVRAYGMTFLGRARGPEAAAAHEVDGASTAASLLLVGLCAAAGLLPGFVIDALDAPARSLVGAAMPPQASIAWLSIIPVAASRSSYNGLLVAGFIASSAAIVVLAIHRLASRAVRRAPAWDCGFPDPDPATQYSPSGFAQPIRRVFGTTLLGARDRVVMPPPGSAEPAVLEQELHDPAWEALYAPLAGSVGWIAERANRLQFLTIRQYLSLVFGALVLLLCVLAAAS
jgi:formate hydrogenlyase subunit 3/multisubunit Na+/H+ antiporter MnhD subunit